MIYFDNSATTPLCSTAKERMLYAMEHFGNPSSYHQVGLEGLQIKKETRALLYKAFKARKEKYEVVFTSGGTEANNMAIFGVARAKNYKNPKIIVTDSEHPCILEPVKLLEKEGFEVVYLSTKGGKPDFSEFQNAMDERTVLISMMSVNNETGAIYDVKRFFDYGKTVNPSVICHTDGVQAFMKIPFTVASTGADLLTVSSHKIGGPKGAGALLISREVLKRRAILPLMVGGGQEDGLRSGTENTISIAGFGGALSEHLPTFEKEAMEIAEIREEILKNLPEEVKPNLPEQPAPHILSLTLPNIKSETVVHFFSSKNICVANGSACSSNGSHKGSYVLRNFGLADNEADSTIRVSLGSINKKEEVAPFMEALKEALETLVRFK